MSISATLQVYDQLDTFDKKLDKALLDVYTVLKLDFNIERKIDKTTNKPNELSFKSFNVTIRVPKEAKATFHRWIAKKDSVMNGEINIYDSTGLLSSTLQDSAGTGTVVDTEDIPDLLMDMTGEAMSTGMDDASKYDERDLDKYDELSHKDLLARAKEKGIELTNKDSDDDIRELLRQWDKVKDTDVPKVEVGSGTKKISDMSSDELKNYAKKNNIDEPTEEELKKAGQTQDEYYREKIKNREKGLIARDKQKTKSLAEQSYTPAYQKADELKKRTVNSLKGVGTTAVKRNFEVARCIKFQDALCSSLKETFVSNPDSAGKFDTKYPWVLEIGIFPKKVTVTGEQLAGKNVADSLFGFSDDESTAVFDGLYA